MSRNPSVRVLTFLRFRHEHHPNEHLRNCNADLNSVGVVQLRKYAYYYQILIV